MSRKPIRALDDHVIDQIAAGEVIERPASIVKELIENSLDAGAEEISIEIDGGGIDRISVRDNGHGIAAAQLPLALKRHHTSKLDRAEQLVALESLGFRGEALASIAAVANSIIASRTASDTHGWRLQTQPGREPAAAEPYPQGPGTWVEVSDLFANVPARRRFLKQIRTEFLHIQSLIRRAAFCYPEVAFKLSHDDRSILNLGPADSADPQARRWRTLFGSEFADAARVLSFDVDGIAVQGFAAPASYSRQNSDLQFVAVNRRVVRDRQIAHAVRMAYQETIPEGRNPAYAIRVLLAPDQVDVNVHPGKAEVRFRNPRIVHDIVYVGVKQVLENQLDVSLAERPSALAAATNIVAETPAAAWERPSRVMQPRPVRSLPAAGRAVGFVAPIDNRYLVVERDDTVNIFDASTAVAALVEARLNAGDRESRPLLVPVSCDANLTDGVIDGLSNWGIRIDRLSDRQVVLRAVPVVASHIEPQQFIEHLLDRLVGGGDHLKAIAEAVGSALEIPSTLDERRRWFGSLTQLMIDFEVDAARYSRPINSELAAHSFLTGPT